MNEINKTDFVAILIKLAISQIEKSETDRQNAVTCMSENNLAHYLEGQDKMIQNWRQLVSHLQKHQSKASSRVEDGALVKISGGALAEWIYIYKLKTTLNVEGIKVAIDDGQLGRVTGSIHGAAAGDKIELVGDGRRISNIHVQILKVL
jgi:hypothetical protein